MKPVKPVERKTAAKTGAGRLAFAMISIIVETVVSVL